MTQSWRSRLFTRAATTALTTAYAPAYGLFLAAGRDRSSVRAVQGRLLAAIVRRNASTHFGRAHDFARLRSVADYQAAVPLSRWDDYADSIEQVAAGVPGVLTADRVRLLEPSSGSTAATKLIPYPASLAAEFQRAIQPWLFDLFTQYPKLRRGRSYWSVTPAATHPPTPVPGGIPIGFEDDADYLGPWAKRLMNAVFAVPSSVARMTTMDDFRLRTAQALLAAEDLALVSVWNPTFFTLLLDWMRTHAAEVTQVLPQPRRARVRAAMADDDWTTVWPHLAVVSAWADAHAAAPAAALATCLPQAHFQPKGLLATEGCVSIPVVRAGGAVLAARSHVVEFLTDGHAVLADQVEPGGRYEIVLTTSGGLYRYRLGDVVEITGFYRGLPIVRLVGRADKVSDVVGEKLSESFVAQCLNDLGVSGFATLVPHRDHYVLLVEQVSNPTDVAEVLDHALRANVHYDYARRLGQLGPVTVLAWGSTAPERYLAAQMQRGQRLGDIKPTALITDPAWLDALLSPATDQSSSGRTRSE